MSGMETFINCFKKGHQRRQKFNFLCLSQWRHRFLSLSQISACKYSMEMHAWQFLTSSLFIFIFHIMHMVHGERRGAFLWVKFLWILSNFFSPYILALQLSLHLICVLALQIDGSFIFLFRFFHLLSFAVKKEQ